MPWSATGDGIIDQAKLWVNKKFGFTRETLDGLGEIPKCGLLVAYKLWHTKDTVSGQSAMKFSKGVKESRNSSFS